jgi:tRNA threonylcarbamoyladenosine biosynthesis protein TsaB
MLTELIAAVMEECSKQMRDLSAVAVSSGPGSYTGLRIGTSVAKGICYGLGKPLIGVPTLQGMAYSMSLSKPDPTGIYIPMIDARRQDVYVAVYDSGNRLLEGDRFETVDEGFYDTLSKYGVKNIYFGGSGSPKVAHICSSTGFGTIVENIKCVANNICSLAYIRYAAGLFENITYFEPFYLKEFEGRMKIG